MHTISLQTAQKKILRLERMLSILVILVLAHIGVSYMQDDKLIQANGFQLINNDKQVMAGLEFSNGYPSFYLMDNEGNKRLVATHDNEGTQLFLNDEKGTTRVGVAQFAHGGGGFALHGENSKGAAVLYFKKSGSLRFFDDKGQVTNQVSAVK